MAAVPNRLASASMRKVACGRQRCGSARLHPCALDAPLFLHKLSSAIRRRLLVSRNGVPVMVAESRGVITQIARRTGLQKRVRAAAYGHIPGSGPTEIVALERSFAAYGKLPAMSDRPYD